MAVFALTWCILKQHTNCKILMQLNLWLYLWPSIRKDRSVCASVEVFIETFKKNCSTTGDLSQIDSR